MYPNPLFALFTIHISIGEAPTAEPHPQIRDYRKKECARDHITNSIIALLISLTNFASSYRREPYVIDSQHVVDEFRIVVRKRLMMRHGSFAWAWASKCVILFGLAQLIYTFKFQLIPHFSLSGPILFRVFESLWVQLDFQFASDRFTAAWNGVRIGTFYILIIFMKISSRNVSVA